MAQHARRRLTAAAATATALLIPIGYALSGSAPAGAAPATTAPDQARQRAFADAAAATGVPAQVLLAVGYDESRWEQHAGAPSTTGAYGVMALTDVPAGTPTAKGEPAPADSGDLVTAAELAGLSPDAVREDQAANIRAGAALLASYAKRLNRGALPTTLGGWYGAVAAYTGSTDQKVATGFADQVFDTIAAGAARSTADGQRLSLAPTRVTPDRGTVTALGLKPVPVSPATECPAALSCDFVPAAYAQNSAAPGDYGDYDTANRANTRKPAVQYIVMHDTESSYASTLATFTTPSSFVSAHYVVRSADGHVTQLVPTKDVAWHAGNWYVNMHSVGIEQEGYAIQGATWYTEALYQSSATLVKYLAAKYGVPLDRQHVIGHDNVPSTTGSQASMHWDPGPFWDWGHFMALLGKPLGTPDGAGAAGTVVTVAPVFAQNQQSVTDCEGGNATTPVQGTSFVWLRTDASDTAPLFSDPSLHTSGAGTLCGNDWGDKASAGQQYVVAGQQGDWTAIWFAGSKVWFKNTGGSATVKAHGTVVGLKPGVASTPVYGRAYPEQAAYPSAVPYQTIAPLQGYTITAGQAYVSGGTPQTDYYYAKTIDSSLPGDHTDVAGAEQYVQIQIGHRVGFVKAADVVLSTV